MLSRRHALGILRRHEPELKARGIRRAAIFGSVARGEATTGSDLDILIEIEDEHQLNVFQFAGLKRAVAELFPHHVDVVNASALKPEVERSVRRDLVCAF